MKNLFIVVLFIIIPFAGLCQNLSPKYEFRGVWIATVENIDWPSKPGLPVTEQREEIIDILDMHQKNGMNAIILQIRPASDAFYQSDLEPWSKYLTGYPGRSPNPFYDPLEFWIDECHKHGMEFHAWLNPYRVAQNYEDPLAGNHIAFEHPNWILKYGERLYFDPGLPETRNFVTKVVTDIVSRYDVDAIHFDDYFYPYPLQEEFPDTASFKKYNRAWPDKYKADWRRENIDILIRQLSTSIKKTKPWVKFGISPFGVWRNKSDDPKGSDTRAGATNFDHLYANVIKWQEKGWIDYLLPQLYWQIGHSSVDFELLANWWKNHSYDREMYIGHGVYKIDPESNIKEWTMPDELPKQIETLRAIPEIGGSAFYSSKHFNRDLLGLQDSLQNRINNTPAIIPPMPWINNIIPSSPEKFRKSGKKIKWKVIETNEGKNKPVKFVIYMNEDGKDSNPQQLFSICLDEKFKFKRINKKRKKYEVRITALDRLNNESKPTNPVIIKL
ncbi:MAG: family 10 glycosylhydrolase [Mariniphaga sp.]|nr:family 10 glycosylhydrolase [Mariniphaga sp.]